MIMLNELLYKLDPTDDMSCSAQLSIFGKQNWSPSTSSTNTPPKRLANSIFLEEISTWVLNKASGNRELGNRASS